MENNRHIVFIHGMFMNPKSWEEWMKFFSDKGYTCHAPAWPYHDGDPAFLRASPDPSLGKLTLGKVVESHTSFIQSLGVNPILIGHSMGGLVAQKLISNGMGRVGVCIDTAPPKGIFSFKWSFLKSNLPTINPLKGNSLCRMDVDRFHYTFCNVMTKEETTEALKKLVVPESRNVPRSSTGHDGEIDFSKPHVPLLFIAGEKDNIIPSSLNKKNYEAYCDPTSTKDFKEFPGRSHFICGQKGWEEVAGFVAGWLQQNL